MNAAKILLRLRAPQGLSRTVKAYINVRDSRTQHPKQLHLCYFGADGGLEPIKDRLLQVLTEKWPRNRKPKAIDWEDAEHKLGRIRLALQQLRRLDVPSTRLPLGPTGPGLPVSSLPEQRLSLASEAVSDEPPKWESIQEAQTAKQSARGDSYGTSRAAPKITQAIVQARPILERVAAHLTRSRDDAEDLVQETLVRGLRSAPEFEADSSDRSSALTGWLIRVMRNLHIDMLRHKGRWQLGDITDADTAVVTVIVEGESEQELWNKFKEEDVVEASCHLSPGMRDVFLLATVKGYPYSRVASELRIPLNSVGPRLSRARQKLRELLLSSDRADPR